MVDKAKAVAATPKNTALVPGDLDADLVRAYLNPHVTEAEAFFFLQQCVLFDLNPFKREIYLIKYSEKDPAQYVISYDVFIARANKIALLDGWEVEVSYKEGSEIPDRATIVIYRKGWSHPFKHSVRFKEYLQYTREGNVTKMWATKEETMIRKVVSGQGFRLCFPTDLGGLPYMAEELGMVEGDLRKVEPEAGEIPKVEVVPDSTRKKAKALPEPAAAAPAALVVPDEPEPEAKPEPKAEKPLAQAVKNEEGYTVLKPKPEPPAAAPKAEPAKPMREPGDDEGEPAPADDPADVPADPTAEMRAAVSGMEAALRKDYGRNDVFDKLSGWLRTKKSLNVPAAGMPGNIPVSVLPTCVELLMETIKAGAEAKGKKA
jgi:phage recombination protein Bet